MSRKNCLGFVAVSVLAVLFLVTSLITITAVTNNPVKNQVMKIFAWIPEGTDNPDEDVNEPGSEEREERESEDEGGATTTGGTSSTSTGTTLEPLSGGVDGVGTPVGGYTLDQIINTDAALNRSGYDCRLGGCAPGEGEDKVEVSGFYKAPNGNYYPVSHSAGGPSGSDLAYITANLADPAAAKAAADAALVAAGITPQTESAPNPFVTFGGSNPELISEQNTPADTGKQIVPEPEPKTVILRTSDDFATARQYAEYSLDANGKTTFIRYVPTKAVLIPGTIEKTDEGFIRTEVTRIINTETNQVIDTITKLIEPQVGEQSTITIRAVVPDVGSYRESSTEQAEQLNSIGEITASVTVTPKSLYDRPPFNLLYPSTYNRSYNDNGKKYNTVACGGGEECASGYCGNGACSDPYLAPAQLSQSESDSFDRPAFSLLYPSTWNRSYNDDGKKYNAVSCGGGNECASSYCNSSGVCANPVIASPQTVAPADTAPIIVPSTSVQPTTQSLGQTLVSFAEQKMADCVQARGGLYNACAGEYFNGSILTADQLQNIGPTPWFNRYHGSTQALYWCTQLVLDVAESAGIDLDDSTNIFAVHTMFSEFQSKGLTFSRTDVNIDNIEQKIRPGMVAFVDTPIGDASGGFDHVALVKDVAVINSIGESGVESRIVKVDIIQSNSAVVEATYELADDGILTYIGDSGTYQLVAFADLENYEK